MKSNLIIKLNTSNDFQTSNEGLKINKIISSISPFNFIKLLHYADNKVNPRIAKENSITKSIHETLETSPGLFWYNTKGLLIATENCKILDRNRIEISMDNLDFEGIMDGGHNTLAIATFIIEKLFNKTIKTWVDCKSFWDDNYEEILKKFEVNEEKFKFSIPVEIITPDNTDGSLEEFYDFISEICSARNNNVQLKESAKGNQIGYYDILKEVLDDKFNNDIIWKTGDKGRIKSEDVISLASIPLIFLYNNGFLPQDLKGLNRISLYSQKSRCVDFFNDVISHEAISTVDKGKHIINDSYVFSTMSLVEDILVFFDKMYLKFPELYHSASPGKFGRISAVTKKDKPTYKLPFHTTDELSEYQYPYAFFYPLISGLTSLMKVDEKTQSVVWKINPTELDLSVLDLTQYVNIIKFANFDPQKIGKGDFFYVEAENIFRRLKD
jgi:hypothetical protein